MTMISRGCLVVAAWLMLVASGLPVGAQDLAGFIRGPGEAKRAVAAILDKIGGTPKIYAIRIENEVVVMQVQGAGRATDIDEWRFARSTLLFFGFERASGPQPIGPPGFIKNVGGGFFDLAVIPLDAVPAVTEAAIRFAAFDDPPSVTAIEIARDTLILPDPHFGDVRWRITLTSARESATVITTGDGRIIGGDLSQTNRSRNLDLINQDDWPKEQAIRDLTGVLGTGRVLRDLTVYDGYISLVADHPTAEDQTQSFSWSLSGVTTMGLLTPLFPGRSDDALFAVADVDLKSLPQLRKAARAAWGNDTARIIYFLLKRDMEATGAPELRWSVIFNDGKGDKGEVVLGLDGTVRNVDLPPSRRPKRDWMAPETVVDTIGRIGAEFSPQAPFTQIMVQHGQVHILAEDPRGPGANGTFLMDEEAMRRSGTPMPWEAEIRKNQTFLIADLAFFDAEKLKGLLADTYRRLGTDPIKMPLSRYTFSVGQLMTPDGTFMVPSRDGRVTLEIRVEAANRMDGGWVTYSSTGEAIDVMTP